ncbi:MAG: DUF4185 domain-containing protein [Chloroflexota bacterium]|nr:DUF4185 domain-containing protein [Chloroflexota bacterium]
MDTAMFNRWHARRLCAYLFCGCLLMVVLGCTIESPDAPTGTPPLATAEPPVTRLPPTPHPTDTATVQVRTVVTDEVRELGSLPNPPTVRGRDGGSSGVLGGQMLWTFGDTIFTKPNEQGAGGIANSAALAPLDDPTAITATLDAAGAPVPLLPYTEEETRYNQAHGNRGDDRLALWPAEVVALADRSALVFYQKLAIHPGAFNFEALAVGLARIAPGSTVAQRDPGVLFAKPEPLFTDGAVVKGDQLYLYACAPAGQLDSACKVGRVARAQAGERGAYRFWNGSAWVMDATQATPVLRGPTSGVSVAWNSYLGQYLAVYSGIVSSKVLLRTAPQPEGPWSTPVVAFAGEPAAQGQWDYAGREHPELAQEGGKILYVSYYRPLKGLQGELRLVQLRLK